MLKNYMKQYLKLVYAPWSKIYDSLLDKIFRFDREKAIRQLKIRKGDKILEIGIGTGLNLPYYPKHCEVHGIDMSKAMLAKARKKTASCKSVLRYMDAASLKYEKNYFDKVLATYVLRVSPQPAEVMKEAARVTKQGGLFVILDQFNGRSLLMPLELALGFGKNPEIKELIRNTPWKIKENIQFGKMKQTRLYVLENKKKK